jgi:hypothetical protein
MAPILPGCDVLPAMSAETNVRTNSTGAPATKGKSAADAIAGRFATINTFADFGLPGLSRAEIAVWLLLWRDTKPDGLARTSQASLAGRAGADDRTVRRALAKLQKRELVTVVLKGRIGSGPSAYRVRAPAHR